VRLTVVGCSGSFPGPYAAASCYLVEADGFTLVLDLGSGSIGPLQRYVELDAVGAVLVSHLHADHCADLSSYYVARRYHPRGPLPPVDVYGPAGVGDHVARAYGTVDRAALDRVFTFHDIGVGQLTVGPFLLTLARTAHPVECHATRVEVGGASLVYTGDTGPSDAVVALAAGTDLLLAEASFVDGAANPANLHLTGRDAGEMALAAGVGRLVVTHVPPWHDPAAAVAEAEAAFGRECALAVPGSRFEVG